jgi:alpha/beta superfamily hydrolase
VLRWNTRGTTSASGTSEGHFEGGQGEGLDLQAALEFAQSRAPPNIWLVGWSFGTDVTLRHGLLPGVAGAILLSPPSRWTDEHDFARWAQTGTPLVRPGSGI